MGEREARKTADGAAPGVSRCLGSGAYLGAHRQHQFEVKSDSRRRRHHRSGRVSCLSDTLLGGQPVSSKVERDCGERV
uniref:Uncharacterized protein n=1 Tax=Knipowitschia caucasica TaxID=637954 RepID=A0AAV2LGQ9_KNICA